MNALMRVGNRVTYADPSATVIPKAPMTYHNPSPEKNETGVVIGVVDILHAVTCSSQPV